MSTIGTKRTFKFLKRKGAQTKGGCDLHRAAWAPLLSVSHKWPPLQLLDNLVPSILVRPRETFAPNRFCPTCLLARQFRHLTVLDVVGKIEFGYRFHFIRPRSGSREDRGPRDTPC